MAYQLETRELERGMKDYEKELKAEVGNILRKSGSSYADHAAKYVPPRINGKWSKSIPAKLYKRSIGYLPALIHEARFLKKEYGQKLREGYRFVVQGLLHGKTHRWYATTKRKAATYTRIYNRGLFKMMFGANLASVGEDPPGIFKRLGTKSPNLLKHLDLNVISMESKSDNESIRLSNNAWGNSPFARESIYQGEKAAKKTMKSMWKKWNEKRKEV